MPTLRCVLIAMLLLSSGGLQCQPLEHQVKAAFLFRLLSFAEWAPHALPTNAPIVVAVLDADDVYAELRDMAAGRSVNDRTVKVQRQQPGVRPDDVHLLFVGREATSQLRTLSSSPDLLLVAESEGALEQGALINFVIRDNRVRFELAPDEAESRGVRLGARMLAVAVYVRAGRLKR